MYPTGYDIAMPISVIINLFIIINLVFRFYAMKSHAPGL